MYGDTGEIPEGEYTIPLGVSEVKREGTDCTIIGWSKMVKVAKAAAEQLEKEGISVEIVDPRTLRPLDDAPLIKSVQKTGRCVILEEGWPVAGFGAEIAYRVGKECFDDLDHPVIRETAVDIPMPYNRNLEKQVVVGVDRAVAAVKKALYMA